MRIGLLATLLVGCTTAPTPVADGGPPDLDAGQSLDSGSIEPIDAGRDAGTPILKGPFDAGVRPPGPTPGELTYWQLELPIGAIPRTGEAAIVIGPDGTVVLIDVGNSNHDDEVRTAVRELNTQWLTPARGYRTRTALEVDWVVLTHFHADHVGAFEALTTGTDALTITRGVLHRGFVDVGAGTNANDFEAICTSLRGPLTAKNVALCTAAPESTCRISARAPATSCPGLLLGDLSRADDDQLAQPSFIPLGGGARLDLLAAGGFARRGATVLAAPSFGVAETNEENARSVVGLLRHGAFTLLFAGDLSGSGAAGEPDLETFVIANATLGARGVDVSHANHHARKTSSNAAWVDACAPRDGLPRNVIAGINTAYVNSPHQETLDAWLSNDRLKAGRFWVTKRAPAAGTNAALVDLDGRLVLQTTQAGDGYWIDGAAWPSVRRE